MFRRSFKLIFTNSFVFQLLFHNLLKHRTEKQRNLIAITCKARMEGQDGFFPGAVEHSHPSTLGITEAAQVKTKIRR